MVQRMNRFIPAVRSARLVMDRSLVLVPNNEHTQFVLKIVLDIVNKAVDEATRNNNEYTKKGTLRKRKKFSEPLTERKRIKKENKRNVLC